MKKKKKIGKMVRPDGNGILVKVRKYFNDVEVTWLTNLFNMSLKTKMIYKNKSKVFKLLC